MSSASIQPPAHSSETSDSLTLSILQHNYEGHCPLPEVYLIYTTFRELARVIGLYGRAAWN